MAGVSMAIGFITLVWLIISTISKEEKKKKSSKANKTKRLKQKYTKVREHFEGTYVMRKKRVDENFNEVFMEKCPKQFSKIYKGKVAVWDKNAKEVVLVVQMRTFAEMSRELKEEFEYLTMNLYNLKNGAASITSNKALRSGKMFALGWRPGTDKGLSVGRYVPSSSTQKSICDILKWEHDQEEIVSWIGSFYRKRFNELGRVLFEIATKEAMECNIPDISQTEFVDLKSVPQCFASNLTYTIDEFSNSVHQDRDHNSYSYGIWAPIFSNSGKLASINDGFQCTGGEFIIPSYESFVDFEACDGVVEIVWRGKTDFHATVPSTTIPGFTRLGTSVQISRDLVHRIRNLVVEQSLGININSRVRGVKKIVDQKLHILK